MESNAKDEYELAYEAYEEACLMDDYLVDVELISVSYTHLTLPTPPYV